MFPDIHTHNIHAPKWESIFSCNLNSPETLSLVNERFVSIGWHPWDLKKNEEQKKFASMESLAKHKNVLAIGETGLDKLSEINLDYQIVIFKKHIALSEQIKKPLIIHCVRAFNELVSLKGSMQPKQIWIMHGFNNNSAIANTLQNSGIFLSFGKALLNENSNASNIIASIPPEKFFLETDNSNVDIEDIYQNASLRCGIEIEQLKKIQLQNFRIFR